MMDAKTCGLAPDGIAKPPGFVMEPRKVALVAIDWRADGEGSQRDDWDAGFAPLFKDIAELCDRAGCDTLVYALWSHYEHNHSALTRDKVFGSGPQTLRWVILENETRDWRVACAKEDKGKHVGDASTTRFTQVWEREQKTPHELYQRLAVSDDCRGENALLQDMAGRSFGHTRLLLCGEINVIATIRGSDEIIDGHGFLDTLRADQVRVLLNPGHSYMVRHETKKKRRALSRDNRWVVAVWNRGANERVQNESHEPWLVYHNGQDMTDKVIEHAHDLGPDIRIGVVDLNND